MDMDDQINASIGDPIAIACELKGPEWTERYRALCREMIWTPSQTEETVAHLHEDFEAFKSELRAAMTPEEHAIVKATFQALRPKKATSS